MLLPIYVVASRRLHARYADTAITLDMNDIEHDEVDTTSILLCAFYAAFYD